ncbi:MAG: ABC transporter ATP-binding protein, partial [Oscillospiraceae bacterium]
MMKKDKNLLSWSESLKINFRAFKDMYNKSPKMIISNIAYTIWKNLTPYIAVYFSALIINELAGAKNQLVLTKLVLITLISAAIIALIYAVLSRWKNIECSTMFYDGDSVLNEKNINMDFANIDDVNVSKLYSKIKQFQNGGGWGYCRLFYSIEAIVSATTTILGGCALTVSLFLCKVPQNGGWLTALNSPLFILLIIVAMLIIAYTSSTLAVKAESYFSQNMELHALSNRLFSAFGMLGFRDEYATDIRMYRQDHICSKYMNDKTDVFGSQGMFAKLSKGIMGFYSAASGAVPAVFTGIIYIFVCLKALGGAFGLGSIMQYIGAVTLLSKGVTSIMKAAGEMRNNATFLKLRLDYLDIKNNMYQGSLTIEKRMDRKYEIEFKNVSFKYPNSETYSLKNVNMKFRIGEHLAVVGQNGSGKTTFIKLLCRLYDPTEGEIFLNGINIKKYNYLEYMSIFSVVFQDFVLFPFSLGENVATKINYDKEKVLSCLEKAGFADRILNMPQGLETYLYKTFSKDGVDISGGEAQKIALARALYKDAPFTVLDEPTAALDPIAEAEIYSKFDNIVGDTTAIYI